MFRIIFLLFLGASQVSWATCDDSLPAVGSRDDVLIIVNDNAVDSCEVGRYYAEKRQLGKNNILHVKVEPNPTISYAQFEIFRNQIIRGLQQKLTTAGIVPVTCTGGTLFCAQSVTQLKEKSTIRYIVTTKGVPTRIRYVAGEPWVWSSTEAGSVDGYIRGQLGNFHYPARLDGLDLTAAKRLIDRAVDVEKAGWYGALLSTAVKGSDGGVGPGGTRFAKSDYHPVTDYVAPVLSEQLTAPHSGDLGGEYIVKDISSFPEESHQHWRYQFGMFNETAIACTGNTTAGNLTDFYLNNSPVSVAGAAPAACRVKLFKGNGTIPGYGELPPGLTWSRMRKVVDPVAYLGHLDYQPSLAGDFPAILNWRKNSDCAVTLCQDSANPALCRATSTDVYKELNTECIGVADGFIGHNLQSYPTAFFTAWPTRWQPLERLSTTAGAEGFGAEIGGGVPTYVAYPLIKDGDGDGDTTSLWFGSHDRVEATTCYQSDLTATTPCSDFNNVQIGQKLELPSPINITAAKYYRVSLSYRSLHGEVLATDKLRVMLTVRDPNLAIGGDTTDNHVALRSRINPTLVDFPLRDSTNTDVVLGVNSGSWKRVSAEFKLDPDLLLQGSTKSITGWSIIIFNAGSFSGSVGLDRIVLEEINESGAPIAPVELVNTDFRGGHSQFAIGDWAATFTSRLNGAAFWGSSTHNDGGTGAFKSIVDTLAEFMRGETLAKSVWQRETGNGGLLYGDPLYSPIAIGLLNTPRAITKLTGVTLRANVLNGLDSANIQTSYSVKYCHSTDFFVCDRTPGAWVATGISGNQSGLNISFGALDTTLFLPNQPFLLRLQVTTMNTITGRSQTFNDFSQAMIMYLDADDADGDGLSNGDELAVGTDMEKPDSDLDGFTDGFEYYNGYDPLVKYTGKPDADNDGLGDQQEHLAGLNRYFYDTDGDGYSDFLEVYYGGNPHVSTVMPSIGFLRPPYYVPANRLFSVTIQKTNPASVITMRPYPISVQGATFVAGQLQWTPTTGQRGHRIISFFVDGVAKAFDVEVVVLDGDLNGDGLLNGGDLVLMKKLVLGLAQPTQKQIYQADFYPLSKPGGVPDNKLDLSDLIVMERKLMVNPQ